MVNTRLGQWLSLLVCLLVLLTAEGIPVGITYVQNAVAKGAGEKNWCTSILTNVKSFSDVGWCL